MCLFYFICSSYCEREFRDCRLQTCYVQSPAYPGLYPRALKCRYRLHTRQPFIKLYLQNEQFAVDGQRYVDTWRYILSINLIYFLHFGLALLYLASRFTAPGLIKFGSRLFLVAKLNSNICLQLVKA